MKLTRAITKNRILSIGRATVIISSFLFVLALLESSTKPTKLMIGMAEVNYTPEVGIDLMGNYREKDYASRGIHDSLYSKAIVAVGENGVKVAIISVDICVVRRVWVEFMRAYIASKTDIKAENIMITATHTHSGPQINFDNPKHKEYLLKIADAAILANQRLKPTILSVGRAKENRISHNRRLKCIDGTTHMCWEKFEPGFVIESWGPIDPEIITVSMQQEGKPTGVLVNFGCHATTLTGNNWLISADYPGYLSEAIRKVKGKDFFPMFLNGASGNVTQVDYRVGFPDTYQECQRIGYLLGVSGLEAMENEEVMTDNTVAVSKEMVPLKKMSISDGQLAWANAIMKKVEKEGMPPIQANGIPEAVYAKSWIEMRAKQDQIDSIELMVVRIGDIAFTGIPGEPFCEFGMDIKARSPYKNTIVMGITNDSWAYFPTKVSYTQGPKGFTPYITGYETTPGSSKFEIGSGEILVESAINQLKFLKK